MSISLNLTTHTRFLVSRTQNLVKVEKALCLMTKEVVKLHFYIKDILN